MLVLHYLIMLSDCIIKEQATVCSVLSFPGTDLLCVDDAGSWLTTFRLKSPWRQWCEQPLLIGRKGF